MMVERIRRVWPFAMVGPGYDARASAVWGHATSREQALMRSGAAKRPWRRTDDEIRALLSAERRARR